MKLKINTKKYFQSIGQFSFIKQIGVGSFGFVKLALHILTNKCYAIKIVDIGSGISQNQILLLQREINLHSTLDHPHIIKLWDTLIEENIVYMIMEIAENGTLFGYQNKHRIINQAEAYKFFSQTLSAINFIHSNDIMHRDLKPENILLDSSNNIKICDFGWATDNIKMKRKTFCGTYQYMAPEMVFDKQYNYSIDIWALGILIYELLHSYAPFPAKNIQQLREKIKLGYYQLGNNFSKELKNMIIEILQFDPQQRPAISKIVSHPWMIKMRKQIIGQIGKIQHQLKGEHSNRAKVEKDKASLMHTGKKHKRLDSLVNQPTTKNMNFMMETQANQFSSTICLQNKKKKKCKTQGEESIQKLFTQEGKIISSKNSKLKKEKQNSSQIKLSSQISKASLLMKNDGVFGAIKMKKITDKLNQMTNKFPIQKKKTKLRCYKQDCF